MRKKSVLYSWYIFRKDFILIVVKISCLKGLINARYSKIHKIKKGFKRDINFISMNEPTL